VKILVTGGTGFLGSHLVERLVAQRHSVRVIGRSAPARPVDGKIEFLEGDLRDPESLRRAARSVEVIYHLAGLVSFHPRDGRAMYELHVDGTRRLLEAARESEVQRIILASTSGTIAASKEEAVGSEDDDYPIAVVGRWPYYLSKIYQEKLALRFCREHSIPLVVLNPSLLLGPGDDRLSSTWIVAKFLNQELPAMPSGGLSFVDCRDAADAFAAALTSGEVFGRHLMGLNMSFREFFGRLHRLTGVPAPRIRVPSTVNVLGAQLLERWARMRGTEPPVDQHSVEIGEHFFYVDPSKSERLLDFRTRDPQQTLQATVDYLMSKMPADSLPGIKGKLKQLRERASPSR
jgi:dihydroflavonol-4-reductase